MAQQPEDEPKVNNSNPYAGQPDNIPTPAPAPPIASPDPMGLMTPTSGPEAAPPLVNAPTGPAGSMGSDVDPFPVGSMGYDPFPEPPPVPTMGPNNPIPTAAPEPVMGPQGPMAGPVAPTEQEQAQLDQQKAQSDRRSAKKQDKERVNNLLMERARARRGLPPKPTERVLRLLQRHSRDRPDNRLPHRDKLLSPVRLPPDPPKVGIRLGRLFS